MLINSERCPTSLLVGDFWESPSVLFSPFTATLIKGALGDKHVVKHEEAFLFAKVKGNVMMDEQLKQRGTISIM